MRDEDEFCHLKSRITEVKRLASKYKNHPYVEDFMRDWKVIFSYGTHMVEGKINFPPGEIWTLIQHSEENKNKVI